MGEKEFELSYFFASKLVNRGDMQNRLLKFQLFIDQCNRKELLLIQIEDAKNKISQQGIMLESRNLNQGKTACNNEQNRF